MPVASPPSQGASDCPFPDFPARSYPAYPPLVLASERYEVIDGEAEIADRITVHFTPGHTAGLQGGAVRASDAVYFIASDNVPLAESRSTP